MAHFEPLNTIPQQLLAVAVHDSENPNEIESHMVIEEK
jgi:hypothetical protein